MRAPQEIQSLFGVLTSDINPKEGVYVRRPKLAHYTSMLVLEKIATHNEFWLGNPLFMNDIEEVRFGIIEGTNALIRHPEIVQKLDPVSLDAFQKGLSGAREAFDRSHVLDTYVMCFSEHKADDQDGLLSMWRGYGDAGKGVAIVLDTANLIEPKEQGPLVIAQVHYATETERRAWFDDVARRFAQIVLAENLRGDELLPAAWVLFARLRLFSLYTKHPGFSEEQEWRIVYMPEWDVGGKYREFLSYYNGPRGVEPKFKMPIDSRIGQQPDFSLETIISQIILGPNVSSPLATASAQRMLHTLGRPELAVRVIASRIPFRPGA